MGLGGIDRDGMCLGERGKRGEGREERRRGTREKKGKEKKKGREGGEGGEEERGKRKEERTGKKGIKHNGIFLVLGIAKRICLIGKGYMYSSLTRWNEINASTRLWRR